MDFMVAKNALKKIQEAMQEATGPKSLKQRLSGASEKLSQEQLDELQKQVGPFGTTKKINALKDLSTQLQDAGRTDADTVGTGARQGAQRATAKTIHTRKACDA